MTKCPDFGLGRDGLVVHAVIGRCRFCADYVGRLSCRVPYQTRHTFASTLLSAGENPVWVASMMGHKDWAMIIKVYGRWIPSVAPDAGNKVAALWATEGVPKRPKWGPIHTLPDQRIKKAPKRFNHLEAIVGGVYLIVFRKPFVVRIFRLNNS